MYATFNSMHVFEQIWKIVWHSVKVMYNDRRTVKNINITQSITQSMLRVSNLNLELLSSRPMCVVYTKYKAICIPEVTNTVNIPNYLYCTILYYETKAYSHCYDVCVSMSRKCHETHIDQLYVITSRSVRTHTWVLTGPDSSNCPS